MWAIRAILAFLLVAELLQQRAASGEELRRDNSAVLARIRQLRQTRGPASSISRSARESPNGAESSSGNSLMKGGAKPKRYRCYLVEDEEAGEEGEAGQGAEEQMGQKSFFAGFLRDGNANDIVGWEERKEGSEGSRRSEGNARFRYLFSPSRASQQQPSTEKPIIEYVDYEGHEGAHNEQQHQQQQSSGTVDEASSPKSSGVRTTSSGTIAHFDLLKENQGMAIKLARRPVPTQRMPSQKYSAGSQQRPLSASADEEEEEEDSGSKGLEEQEGEELYQDLYITTRRPTTQSRAPLLNSPRAADAGSRKGSFEPKQILSKPAVGGQQRKVGLAAPRRAGQLAPPKAIPHEPVQSGEEEVHEMRPAAQLPPAVERVQSAYAAPTFGGTPSMYGTASSTNYWPQSVQHGPIGQIMPQQVQQPPPPPQQAVQRRTEPARDAQGRPLVLSPEHCRMIDSYAQLYGLQVPANVVGFVHNNCAFAKMYLPAASCEEIDLLVQSCYQRRQQQRN